MKIRITMTVDDSYADPGHAMGVTEEAYDGITHALQPYGDVTEIEQDT